MPDLCEITSLAGTGCCQPPPEGEPGAITNAPALSAVRYRLGTFATFRRRLLAAIPARLSQWKDRGERDYGVALLEMWVTLADILTFYQERIANEAFLRTAQLRDSLVRIAGLVDYRLNPGAAAAAYLAFTVEPPKKGEHPKQIPLPQGFRCQTKPAPTAPPVPFETDEALTVYASLNAMAVQSLQKQSLGSAVGHAIVQGTQPGLKIGDRLLMVSPQRRTDPTNQRWELLRVSNVIQDPAAKTARIEWKDPLGNVASGDNPELHVLRLQAWPFGYNAPDYAALNVTTTATVKDEDGNIQSVTTFTSTPSLGDWTGKKLPEDLTQANVIFLDTLYPTIAADTWAALVSGDTEEIYRVQHVDETAHSGYTLSAKITRLKVDVDPAAEPPQHLDHFPMRGTSVLAQSEPLSLPPVPIQDDVAGDTLTLDAIYQDLRASRLLIVSGRARGAAQLQTEVGRIKTVDQSGATTTIILEANLQYTYDPTTVTIYGNVAPASHGETVANEILGSGDAAQRFQQLALKKTPLTFVRASGVDANRWGTQGALEVRVNGVLYHPREHLLDSGPADRDFVLTIGADDRATLTFGGGVAGADGVEAHDDGGPGGALLPTGRDNVRATYRQGLGARGNVRESAVTTLVSTAPGLKAVINPLPGTGGADREREDEVKANLPAGMRAFDRAVSLEDYEALARTYSGVAKARAFWERRDPSDPAGLRRLEQPRVSLTVAATDRTPPLQAVFRSALRGFLDARRDPNQPLVITDFTPVSVDLAVTIEPEPDLQAERVRADVAAALSAVRNPDGSYGLFAFERLDFGLSVHLSDVYAVVQGVPGVHAALVTTFQHHPRPGERLADIPQVETHIFIRNREILRCDNDPSHPERGTLGLAMGEVTSHGT